MLLQISTTCEVLPMIYSMILIKNMTQVDPLVLLIMSSNLLVSLLPFLRLELTAFHNWIQLSLMLI